MPKNTAVPSAWRISAPAPVAITSGSTPRMKAKRGHQDRPQARRAPLRPRPRSGPRHAPRSACANSTIRMAFLAAKPDQHDEADLRQDVDVHAAQQQPADRGQQAHRHDQDHRQRQRPAFVLRREQQEHEHHRGAEDEDGRCCPPASPGRRARSIRSRSRRAGPRRAIRSMAASA